MVRFEQHEDDVSGIVNEIGRFRLLSRLGHGGMGAVYHAFDTQLEREVAVKVLHPELLADEKSQARFRGEALAASRIDHPGLCPVYEIGEDHGQPYFVMPLLHGETLAARIAREAVEDNALANRTRVAAVVELLEKVADALDQAHQAGLVHRDVKPANILIQPDGQPVVLDFGLARDANSDAGAVTHTMFEEGTPLYMAPEQVSRSGGKPDARTDVYALGVTLYEALTLAAPFSGRSLFDLFVQIRNHPTPDPRTRNRAVSRDLKVIVAVATEKSRRRRYPSCAEFAADLGRVRRGEPIQARPQPPALRAVRWLQLHPIAAFVIATMAVGLAVTSILWQRNADLSHALRDIATSQSEYRKTAETMRQLAITRLDRFDLLSLETQLANDRLAVPAMLPAWPTNTAALRTWLDRVDHEYRPRTARVGEALAQLREQATGTATGSRTRAPTSHELCLPLLKAKRDALRAAFAVRSGGRAFEPWVPGSEKTKGILHSSPDRPLGQYGHEREMLAEMTEVVEAGISQRFAVLAIYAWVLHANGLEDRAHEMMARAVATAPADQRVDIEWEQQYLERTQRDADGELARVEQLLHELEPIAKAPRDLQFVTPEDSVLYATLLRVHGELFDLLRPDMLAARVEELWRWSKALPNLTEHHPGARVTWQDAREAITAADGVVASKAYAEVPIDLTPQWGLVPIGMNPVTRLWEFYHLRSALNRWDPEAARQIEIPQHRPDGSIDVTPGTGIVLVLIPGGMTTIGSQSSAPDSPYYDPARLPNESLMTGYVAPYLLARHELTQAQWARLAGAQDPLSRESPDPSAYGSGLIRYGRWTSLREPVENVTWEECSERLRQHGLVLPSQWQWEHACRAGVSLPYCSNRAPDSLTEVANLLDPASESLRRYGRRQGRDDGHVIHAPVGSYPANPFGLYDMHGNVAEFCSDMVDAISGFVAVRGGSYGQRAEWARSATRSMSKPNVRNHLIGLRVCREIR